MIKAVLFDMDGVLIDSEELMRECTKKALAEFGAIVSDDDLDSIDFDGYLGRGMILTEWSENIADRLPKRYFSVIITKIGENSRDISVYYEER